VPETLEEDEDEESTPTHDPQDDVGADELDCAGDCSQSGRPNIDKGIEDY
jgi:hypothetical protein